MESSPPQLDLDIDLLASVFVYDVKESQAFTAAHLFTQDDLRGNVDLIVAASPGDAPDDLRETLLQNLELKFDGLEPRLKSLAHQLSDPDGSFLIVLSYSVTDMIGEFDRPRLEKWIDKVATDPPVVSVCWDDRVLGTVCLVVAD